MKHAALILLFIGFFMGSIGQVTFIAHRGESALAPENTMAAFSLAWDLQADAVELDIHLSKDNKIMVIHDDNTRRTSGQYHSVKYTESAVLRNLDVGAFKDAKYQGEKIPFLEEALGILPSDKKLVIEIKSGMDVLPELQKVVTTSDRKQQLIFIAFEWQVILAVKRMFPENPCYWLSSSKSDVLVKLNDPSISELDGINLHFMIIDENIMTLAKGKALDVLAWTVDNPAVAKRLIDMGVTSITTNQTGELRTQLATMEM